MSGSGERARAGWPCHWRALAMLVLAWGIAVGAFAQSTPQAPESRLALVIGNARYQVSPLRNPTNDARLMEASLKDAGFKVYRAENVGRREMQRLIREFGEILKREGGVGLFYFSGHGVQVRGANYLVPVDADIRTEEEVAYDSVDAQLVLEKMELAGNRLNMLILDACRSNPFASSGRSAARGLAQMNAPSGTLVAYSTAPGTVALDGAGSNSPYTHHLASAIGQAGLPVEEVFKQVRSAVRRDTNNSQTPWENTALEGQFYFKAPAVQAVAPPPATPVQPQVNPAELAFWDSIRASRSAADYAAYLEQFPQGTFASLARNRQRELQASAQVATASQAPAASASTQVAAAHPSAAATVADPARPSSQAVSSANPKSVLRIRNQLNSQEEDIPLDESTDSRGFKVFASGDVIDGTGQVHALRIGQRVYVPREGRLWSLPLRSNARGEARLIDNASADLSLSVRWSVTAQGGRGGGNVDVSIDQYDSSAHNMVARRGSWKASYADGALVPEQFALQLRPTMSVASAGGLEIIAGTVIRQVASPAAPSAPHVATVPARAQGKLRLNDRMSSRTEAIDVHVTSMEGGMTTFSTGDVIGRNGQIFGLRLGPYVFRLKEGVLWRLGDESETSGAALLASAEDAEFPARVTWKTTRLSKDEVRVDMSITQSHVTLPSMIRTGTWRAIYADRALLPRSFELAMRGGTAHPTSGGPELISGQYEAPSSVDNLGQADAMPKR